MHLPPALLASLRVALGSTALLGVACDQARSAAQPAPAATATPASTDAPRAQATTAAPIPAAAQVDRIDGGDATLAASTLAATSEPPVRRGRLRDRSVAPTSVAPSPVASATTRDAATTFEPCEPGGLVAAAPRPVARPKPRTAPVATPPRAWVCGPCGRG
ncbi:MAG: hypothetical protein U0168_24670 [Nannocystaceae bacterium]